MIEVKTVVNVVIGLLIFRLLDKMLLVHVPILASFEAENLEELDPE